MIYDYIKLEAIYDTTMQGINEVLHELDANHEHITPDLQINIDEAYNILKKVERKHKHLMNIWCKQQDGDK